MMLLSLHIISIAVLVALSGGIAYQMGKQEGLRLAKKHYEAEAPADASALDAPVS